MIDIKKFSEEYEELALKLLKDLCLIPAPSGLEDERAKYCLDFIQKNGYPNAYIDSAKNVIWKIEGETSTYSLFMAHTDTVFPDLEPLPYMDDGEIISCPGVSDDTICLVQLLCVSKFLKEIGYKPKKSLLFSANSCEEGFGNLKGCRQLFKDFGEKIDLMCSFDGDYFGIANKSVGSHRYSVKVTTEGGHSYGKFGNRNAIAVLSSVVNDIYSLEVPVKNGTKTTYNVGLFSGGTSVNTIAQTAEMFCEYRSDDMECLKIMQEKFADIFNKYENKCEKFEVVLLGERPGMGNVDQKALDELTKKCSEIQMKYTGLKSLRVHSSSTDCNIPHSLGITAICMGTYDGFGAHTREEYIKKSSVKQGLSIVLDAVLSI